MRKKLIEGRVAVLDEAISSSADPDPALVAIYDREMAELIKRFPESKLSPLSLKEKRRAAELRRLETKLRYLRQEKRELQYLVDHDRQYNSRAGKTYNLVAAIDRLDSEIASLATKARRLRR